MKFIELLSEDTVIKMRGMNRDEFRRLVKNSVGQGTDFAVLLTTYAKGLEIEKYFKNGRDDIMCMWMIFL